MRISQRLDAEDDICTTSVATQRNFVVWKESNTLTTEIKERNWNVNELRSEKRRCPATIAEQVKATTSPLRHSHHPRRSKRKQRRQRLQAKRQTRQPPLHLGRYRRQCQRTSTRCRFCQDFTRRTKVSSKEKERKSLGRRKLQISAPKRLHQANRQNQRTLGFKR